MFFRFMSPWNSWFQQFLLLKHNLVRWCLEPVRESCFLLICSRDVHESAVRYNPVYPITINGFKKWLYDCDRQVSLCLQFSPIMCSAFPSFGLGCASTVGWYQSELSLDRKGGNERGRKWAKVRERQGERMRERVNKSTCVRGRES